jgi:hypothetical protein
LGRPERIFKGEHAALTHTPTRLLLPVAALLGLAGIAQPAQNGQCLVGICGVYSSGYAGVLARHGIPYEVVLDHQLADAALLMKYDAILTATMSPASYQDAAQPLQTYVEAGGCFLFDAPYSGQYFPRTGGMGATFLADFLQYTRVVAPQVGIVKQTALGLLSPDVAATDRWTASRITCDVAYNDPKTVVLAEYQTVRESPKGRLTRFVRGRMLKDGDPAMIMVPRGKGKFIVCGSSIGAAQALGAGQTDGLILALVRLLTDGRGTPQLEPEGVALARRQSKRSLDLATPEETAFLTTAPTEACGVNGPGQRGSLPTGAETLEHDAEPSFDLTGTCSGVGEATVWLNHWDRDNHVRLQFRDRRVEVVRTAVGRAVRLGDLAFGSAGQPLVVQERGKSLRLFVGHERLTVSLESPWIGDVGWQGAALADMHYQPVAPVYFADDFMREEGQQGDWDLRSGTWTRAPVQNPDMGANPFAFHVSSSSLGLALTGYRFWDTYRFRASARPDSTSGSLGLVAYRQDDRNYLLFRCAITEQQHPKKDGFQIVRVLDGREQVLESVPGGLVTGQPYLLEIKLLDKWIGALVDGEKVLTAVDASLPGGGIGLRADSAQVKFDDVVVEPSDLRQNRGTLFDSSLPNYAGSIDQDTWAGPAMQWQPSPQQRGLFWSRGVFYGDAGVRFDTRALAQPGAVAELALNSSPEKPEVGYRLTATRKPEGLAVELSRSGRVVKTASVPTSSDGAPVVAIRRAGNTLYARVGERAVLSYTDPTPLTEEHRIAFRFAGGKPKIADVAYWSDNVLDYAFDSAPTDWWTGSGTWDVTNRWSCTPDWSWFGGTSPQPSKGEYLGKALIWCKRRFEGDVALDYFTGPKMLDGANGRGSRERMQDFNAVLCGDGVDVDSGYAFLVAPGGSDEVKLLRLGKEVASSTDFLMPRAGHNRWTYLRAWKQGGHISLWFEGQLVLAYDDPDPLTGGYCGVWTQDNGILVPKVTIYHQQRGGPLLSLRDAFKLLGKDAA